MKRFHESSTLVQLKNNDGDVWLIDEIRWRTNRRSSFCEWPEEPLRRELVDR